jgi:hypothetical protein
VISGGEMFSLVMNKVAHQTSLQFELSLAPEKSPTCSRCGIKVDPSRGLGIDFIN